MTNYRRVTLPDATLIEYVHDPLGRRIAKKVNGTITEKYLWKGLTTLLAVYDGADNLIQRFEYADGRMPVAMIQGGATYYLSYNQVGSLCLVADSSGNVVKRIEYDSFGNIIEDTNPDFKVPFGFAGGLIDNDTGLVRFGYRDYDPEVGRWTAKDPIFFAGGDTDLYGYVLNDPINEIDPLGLFLGPLFNSLKGATAMGPVMLVAGVVCAVVAGPVLVGGGVAGIAAGVVGGFIGMTAGNQVDNLLGTGFYSDNVPSIEQRMMDEGIYWNTDYEMMDLMNRADKLSETIKTFAEQHGLNEPGACN